MDQPLVSVIIPTRNNEEILRRCLVSLQKQTYPNIEIVIVDGNSTDTTREIAKEYTDMVLVYPKKGDHRCAQRNLGVEKASGQYVFVLDSDMELSERVVGECVEKMQISESVVGVIVPEESFGEGFWAQCKKLERSFYVGVEWMEAARFFKKEMFQNVGGYNSNMISGEDWDLSQRIKKFGTIARVDAYIFHNEGRVSLWKTVKKKYYYAQKFSAYLRDNQEEENRQYQTSLMARYSLFFSRPEKLLKRPFLSIAMLWMKTLEFGFGAIGYVISEIKSITSMKKFFEKMYSNATRLNHKNIFNLFERNEVAHFLDLGCDDGVLTLQMAKKIGTTNISGVEIVPERILQAEGKGISVKNFDLNGKFMFDDNTCDVIHANQVIEHLYDTDNFLGEIYRILKPGGYAIISTENASSWCNIFASVLGWQIFSLTNFSSKKQGIGNPFSLHRDGEVHLDSWNHIRIYNIRGLKEYFEVFGFKIEAIRGAGYFPLWGELGNVDTTHCHFMTFKVKKINNATL